MLKKLTLILISAITLSAISSYAADDLLDVEDFSSGYQIKQVPAKHTAPIVTQPTATQKTLAKKPVVKIIGIENNMEGSTAVKTVPGKPASLQIDHKKTLPVKKPAPKTEVKKKDVIDAVSKEVKKKEPASLANLHAKKIEEKAKQATAAAKKTSTAPIVKRKPVIVIDPGHGGKDQGTMGKLGTREKDITLAYGLALRKELEKSGKYKVVMTRSTDRFIMLSKRVEIARKAGGDVMISIHADSNPNETTRGFSVYTLSSKRANAEAEKLLENSDKEEVVRGAKLKGESKDVKEAVINFAQSSTKDVSDDFAQTVAKNLGRRIQALPKHNREGSLAVLTGSDIPSVLIELGYLSNDYEERLLKRDDHKQQIVTSITAAIDEYFNKFNMVF